MNKYISILILLVIYACSPKNSETTKTALLNWTSQYHPISANYSEKWTLIDPYDSEDLLLFGLSIDKSLLSYIIKVSNDNHRNNQSTFKDYYEFIKETTQNEAGVNLITEEKLKMHGAEYHRMIFIKNTPEWGKMLQHIIMRTTGEKIVEMTIAFPFSSDLESNKNLPDELLNLDKGINIFEF